MAVVDQGIPAMKAHRTPLNVLVLSLALLAAAAAPAPALPPAPTMPPAPAPADDAPPVATLGKPAPPFELLDTTGRTRRLADYEGRIVVLEWLDPDCPIVDRVYRAGVMKEAYRKAREIDGSIAWLAINSTRGTTPGRNDLWIRQQGLAYPVLIDENGAVRRRYDARRAPQMFVIDKEGGLRYHGAIDDNAYGTKRPEETTNFVVAAVRDIVGGDVVARDHVKPYGCRIKYAR